jgi:hypothetical protein
MDVGGQCPNSEVALSRHRRLTWTALDDRVLTRNEVLAEAVTSAGCGPGRSGCGRSAARFASVRLYHPARWRVAATSTARRAISSTGSHRLMA